MKRVNRVSILIGLILFIALSLRVWGANFGLPYLYHPDEPNKIIIAQHMFTTGDLNPHYFKKPTLFIYLNALAYMPYYLFGKMQGAFDRPADILAPIVLAMGVGQAILPTAVLIGRLLTVLFSTASVLLIFVVGKQVSHRVSVGALAAMMMAVYPGSVAHSRSITENSYLVFFIIVVIWASVRILQRGNKCDYIIAGAATGLAASSKYPGIVVLVVPLAAHFMRYDWRSLRKTLTDYRLYLMVVFAPIAFLATTPFAILDISKFLEDTVLEVIHYSTGHPGMEGNSLVWYLTYMWETAGILFILAALEIARGIYSRSKEVLLLSVFPLVYFVFISSFAVRNDRTFLPLTPFLFLLAALFVVQVLDKANGLQSKALRRLSVFGIAIILVTGLVLPTSRTIADTIQLTTVDSRETSRVWINRNIPAGAHIAIESYSPFVDPSRFSVQGFLRMIDYEPEWYRQNGFDYLIFSQGMYGRFYAEPERYSMEVAQYDDLFNRFTLTRKFSDGGYEIRIYKAK